MQQTATSEFTLRFEIESKTIVILLYLDLITYLSAEVLFIVLREARFEFLMVDHRLNLIWHLLVKIPEVMDFFSRCLAKVPVLSLRYVSHYY